MYNWQRENWPHFVYDESVINTSIASYRVSVADLQRKIRVLPEKEIASYFLERMVEEATTTSAIENEMLSKKDLLSSLRNNLNIGAEYEYTRDLRAKSIAQLILLNRSSFQAHLSETTLKYWHEVLMNWDKRLSSIGTYRSSAAPMQIVSGPSYNMTVHFEAPPSVDLNREMAAFIDYVSASSSDPTAAVAKACVSHIYFESIHPFEDGNGRIGRAIVEKLLSQALGEFIPFSISHAIERRRKAYYQSLRDAQHSSDITPWMTFFVACLNEAVAYADKLVSFTTDKYAYLHTYQKQLSQSQLKAINKMFLAGPEGFQGGMTARKYMRITKCSRATATRSLTELATIGALRKRGAGRSVHYVLPQT